MKQVNFTHPGGFPLEQETLERLQTAYRSELYEAFKSHLGLKTDKNYIIAHSKDSKQGWVIIHEPTNTGEGTLFPIKAGAVTSFLKTTKTITNLIYGDGTSQTAYTDYAAEYVNAKGTPTTNNTETINYYDLSDLNVFETVKSIKSIETDINLINKSYLPLNGSKAMEGDLDLGIYHLSKLDTLETFAANVRAVDFRLGSVNKRGLSHPTDALGRALTDNSDQNRTDLTLNYGSDWQNTTIGGKVHLENLNTSTENFTTSSSSENSLLLIDSVNQVIKSNNLLNSLLSRISNLEKEKSATIPIGMIALWGKPAPFPEGWEEYVPLRGRMPIGLDSNDVAFNSISKLGGNKNKKLTINEIPPHTHSYQKAILGRGYATKSDDEPLGSNISETSGETGGGLPFSILNPYKVVHFIEYTGRSSSGINLTASNFSTSTVLNWTPPKGNFGTINYLVYRNDTLIEILDNVLTYTASGLIPSATDNFYIIARNVYGTLSTPSNTIKVNIHLDTDPPTKPTGLKSYTLDNNHITIEWNPSSDNVGIDRYEVYRRKSNGTYGSDPYYTTPGTIGTFYGFINETYYFKVRAIDCAGNYSPFCSEIEGAIEHIS